MKHFPLQISFDRTGLLHRQLYDAIARAISAGGLAPGQRLPSSRALARHLGISRNTVMTAYADLASRGLIAGTLGSGTRVRGRRTLIRRPSPREILSASHYPLLSVALCDPEGNRIHLQS